MNAPPPPPLKQEDRERWLEGVSVLIGGGVEAYTGSLSSVLELGPGWSFILGLHLPRCSGSSLSTRARSAASGTDSGKTPAGPTSSATADRPT
jgi:hypothetical protein